MAASGSTEHELLRSRPRRFREVRGTVKSGPLEAHFFPWPPKICGAEIRRLQSHHKPVIQCLQNLKREFSLRGDMSILYKHSTHLKKNDSDAFDKLHEPGFLAEYPGIYRCENCGAFETVPKSHPLPSEHQHPHPNGQGRIQWRLCVTHR
jgi:hypothetical protein